MKNTLELGTKKKRRPVITIVLIFIVIALTVLPFLITENSQFTGADDKAKEVIISLNTDYKPWFTPFWEPSSSETENFLFALQAAIGSGILFYGLGYMRGRKERRKNNDD